MLLTSCRCELDFLARCPMGKHSLLGDAPCFSLFRGQGTCLFHSIVEVQKAIGFGAFPVGEIPFSSLREVYFLLVVQIYERVFPPVVLWSFF